NKVEELPPDWWGYKFGFVSGGLLGARSTTKKKSAEERTAFHEQDQEDLYNLVQDKATSGKQGLGIKDRPKKIGGARFEGKKKSFSDSEEDDSADDEGSAEDDSMSEEQCDVAEEITTVDDNDSTKPVSSKKRKYGDTQSSEDGEVQKVNLKKLSKRLLQQLKKLKVLIDEHSTSVFTNFSSKRDALAYLKQKLEGSGKFAVEGKKVSLASRRS
ncbi:G-patch domain-containing protein 1, partial [Linum perenne]